MNNKKAKGVLAGLLVTLLAAGVVYAAYTVWTGRDNTAVTEPLSVTWTQTIPAKTYPNQEYTAKIRIDSVDVTENGNQLVGVVATRSNQLVRQDICWDIIGDGIAPNCNWKFTEKMTFTLAKDKYAEVWANVKVPSDATPGAEWVEFVVTRE